MVTDRPNARRDAIVIAVLFIVATVLSILGGVINAPLLGAADHLGAVAANPGTMIVSAMVLFVAAGVIPIIPILFSPYFRRQSEVMAQIYLVARCFEAMLYLVGVVSTLSLIALARSSVAAGTADPAAFEAIWSVVMAMQTAAFNFGPMLFFSLGAVVLSVLLYQTRLVPRWLSIWAFIGALLLLVQGLLAVFELSNDMLDATLFLPIAINEMVFAIWLIVIGFDRTAMERLFTSQT